MNTKTVLLIAATAMFGFLSHAAAHDEDNARTIRVTGEGTVSVKPDMATIQTGVVTQAKLAVDALNANNEVVKKLMVDLGNLNVAEKDMQTSRFGVTPEYNRGSRGELKPEIVGYRVTNQLTVKVRNLPELGKLLDTLIRSGSNQISGISFGVNDDKSVLNDARIKAVENAKSRAELYANAAGVNVGKVMSIDEQRIIMPRPVAFGRSMEASAMSVPIASGEQDFSATVNIIFELKGKD